MNAYRGVVGTTFEAGCEQATPVLWFFPILKVYQDLKFDIFVF